MIFPSFSGGFPLYTKTLLLRVCILSKELIISCNNGEKCPLGYKCKPLEQCRGDPSPIKSDDSEIGM